MLIPTWKTVNADAFKSPICNKLQHRKLLKAVQFTIEAFDKIGTMTGVDANVR